MENVTIQVIARMHSDFPSKFGIPRQSGLVEALESIIVFEPDLSGLNDSSEKLYVKRIIAVEGDHLQIKADDENQYHVYLNGQILREEYLDDFQITKPALDIYNFAGFNFNDENGNVCIDVTVPEGYVFVMGDNRLNSQDSRCIGFVDTRRIAGKVLLRFYPFNKFGTVS